MIRLAHISKTYRMGSMPVRALNDLSLTIEAGEFVAIMGPSGSGKSTLLHTIGLLDQPDSGEYSLDGVPTEGLSDDELADLRSRTVGFVFQQFNLLARTTAVENVELPRLYSKNKAFEHSAEEMLRHVGLGERMTHRPNELSGGEQQRVAIARALINRPKLILADEPTGNLDSSSAAEIMAILQRLHNEGFTLVMVTHDREVARYAHRVVTLRDGRLESDQPQQGLGLNKEGGTPSFREEKRRKSFLVMRIHEWMELARQSLRTLRINKMRTALSALGITIGVAAVIAMVALAAGARASVQQQLSSLGSNLLILRPGSREVGGVHLQVGAVSRLRLEDMDAVLKAIPSIRRVDGIVNGMAQVVYRNKNWSTQVVGSTPDYAGIHTSVPILGRFIDEADVVRRARVAVIGVTVMKALFGDASPIGEFVKMNRVSFQIIGVLPEKGGSSWRDQDDVVVIPLTTGMYRLLGQDYLDRIEIEVANAEDVNWTQDTVLSFMKKRYRMPESADGGFEIRNMAEIQQAVSQTGRVMSFLLAGIAAIALLVGGIGIMNIMLVSVRERIREIGLRKAVGARQRDILAQFLIEAIIISLLGGGAGITLGVGTSYGMSQWAGWTVSVTPMAIWIAFGFSAAVGIVFGLWPALQAARQDPIEALRYE